MGLFTWTDAAVKTPRLTKSGDYYAADKIGYGWCKVICPDDSEIVEPYYEGYGNFGGRDIYELVVDWNKDHLEEIFRKLHALHGPAFYGSELEAIAVAYQKGEDVTDLANDLALKKGPYLRDEWKRSIGITIACDDCNHKLIPYPIKITRRHSHKPYSAWHTSWTTQ